MRFKLFILLIFDYLCLLRVFAESQSAKDESQPTYATDDINYIITGSCLYTYSKFMNEFKRVSRNSLLWPKLNKNESPGKTKHRFSEKYAMFSSFMAIKKILQIQSKYSVNNDYTDTIAFLRLNIALMRNTLESKLDKMTEDEKAKISEIEKRVVESNLVLNKYYRNKLSLSGHDKNLFKIFLRFFIYPAYLDIYNYGNIILSRLDQRLQKKVTYINRDITSLKKMFISLFDTVGLH
ncbi:hypothetical protein OIY81_3289 [Cryptosporidium canis]|uniref:Signal peptide-containing protein n=1 Tax=Cryptosporidium canis TaxID=195482 RepID=A0ABQ8P1T6_9CRYT|nr:hypothetical protein OJ252_3619 [Cryptosporidium canis]KAJ1606117.1 hypothetical protein OIY81_3289 [Cryptosporidium canis]